MAAESLSGRIRQGPAIQLWWHQAALYQAPWTFRSIPFFFVVAGFGSGKSFGDVTLILGIAARYFGHEVVCGMGTSTQTLLRKTLLADLFRVCFEHGIAFSYNAQEAILRIGTVSFISVPTTNPDNIYAYNFSVFICDELDELPQEKALAVFKAVQERVRIPLPDGRLPFTVFSTTAQGYKGTYQIVSELTEKKLPHVIIRAKTKDNLALPREYVNRLYSIYNENERLAFLEGQFVNLSTGRVYYDYDEARHKVGQPQCPIKELPALEAAEEIHIGQDLNAGFSRGVAIVVRAGVAHVIKNWSFSNIGKAPRIIRNDFPVNDIFWYPDASGAEVVAGYQKEFKDEDIKVRVGVMNPSVVDRIFFVNKLFSTGRMYLGPDCAELSMALKVRQYNDSGDPEKGKGAEAPDHYCDGLEYVVWRLVSRMPEFKELWLATRFGRQGKTIAVRRESV